MPARDAELGFADQAGRHFARQYGLPPMTGRVAGWLLICDPPEQTAAEIAEALQASRSAVASAVDTLESFAFLRRTRASGQRGGPHRRQPRGGRAGPRVCGRVRRDGGAGAAGARGAARRASCAPRKAARGAAFHEWLLRRMPALAAEWKAHRDDLRAAGELPRPS